MASTVVTTVTYGTDPLDAAPLLFGTDNSPAPNSLEPPRVSFVYTDPSGASYMLVYGVDAALTRTGAGAYQVTVPTIQTGAYAGWWTAIGQAPVAWNYTVAQPPSGATNVVTLTPAGALPGTLGALPGSLMPGAPPPV